MLLLLLLLLLLMLLLLLLLLLHLLLSLLTGKCGVLIRVTGLTGRRDVEAGVDEGRDRLELGSEFLFDTVERVSILVLQFQGNQLKSAGTVAVYRRSDIPSRG